MYRLVGKYMKDSSLIGFEVCNESGVTKLLRMHDIYSLINQGEIHGCSLITNDNVTHLVSHIDKISDLPIVSTNKVPSALTVEKRIVDETGLIGYVVHDECGEEYRLTGDKVWEIAFDHGFTNIVASIENKRKVIRGKGIQLKNLQTVDE